MQNTNISIIAPSSLVNAPVSSGEIATDRVLSLIHSATARLPLPDADRQDLEHDIIEILLNRARDHRLAQYGLASFIFTTAHLLCRGFWRRKKHWTYLQAGDDKTDRLFEPQAHGPDPEQRVAAAEGLARVRAAIFTLPPTQRSVALPHLIDGVGIDEVAAELRISRRTADVRLCRARRKLIAALGDLALPFLGRRKTKCRKPASR